MIRHPMELVFGSLWFEIQMSSNTKACRLPSHTICEYVYIYIYMNNYIYIIYRSISSVPDTDGIIWDHMGMGVNIFEHRDLSVIILVVRQQQPALPSRDFEGKNLDYWAQGTQDHPGSDGGMVELYYWAQPYPLSISWYIMVFSN